MNAKKRYSFTLISVILLTICYFWASKFREKRSLRKSHRKSYLSDYLDNGDLSDLSSLIGVKPQVYHNSTFCSMSTCFDYSKCTGKLFKIYVYPDDENIPPSGSYLKILNVIKNSRYYTSHPEQACLFVLSIDTLDRDPLSQDYVRKIIKHIHNLVG